MGSSSLVPEERYDTLDFEDAGSSHPDSPPSPPSALVDEIVKKARGGFDDRLASAPSVAQTCAPQITVNVPHCTAVNVNVYLGQ